MIGKINDILAGAKMTAVSGIFLIISFILSVTGKDVTVDPAWAAIIISGLPLVYLSVWRIIYNPGISKISSALMISIAMAAAMMLGDIFAAGEVAFIMAIGAVLEDKTTERAKKGLRRLINLTPQQGRRITEDGKEEMTVTADISKGDILRVLPGETIPVDGTIFSGMSSVDQSIVTGESLPVDKKAGDEVFCGTINRFGSIDVCASSQGEDTSLTRLIRLVEEAEENKAPMARIADKAASWLVPLALLISIISFFVTGDIVRTVTVLVVFCPCALVLATPTAIMAAIGQAAKHGVVIKSGEALEIMGKVDTIAFDKTGTLTEGTLDVSDVYDASGADGTDLIRTVASAERYSEHPLAKAVTEYAKKEKIGLSSVENFSMEPGRGISADVDGRRIFCGNAGFIEERGAEIGEEAGGKLAAFRNEGKAVILVSDEKSLLGAVALSDNLRSDSADAVKGLRDLGTDPVLLTGDHEKTARYFAGKVGIGDIRAELMPEHKLDAVRDLRDSGRTVCMVGDGVNDAPALKTADVSIAMGAMGSDIAVDAADIALMGDDISKIRYLKRLSNACISTIKFSISLSLVINIIAVTMSVMGILTPTTGALVHNAGSCLVVLIAALLYDRKFE